MPGNSRRLLAAMALLLLATLTLASSAKTPPVLPAQPSTVSQQDKAKACNDLGDKKGLKDEDRNTFMQSCLNQGRCKR
jgi:hypothetical protein